MSGICEYQRARSDMEHPYPDVPSTGTHRGGIQRKDVSTSVRGQDPPSEPATAVRAIEPVFRLTRHGDRPFYRIRAWVADVVDLHEETVEEIGVYPTPVELRSALSEIPGPPRYVVFEDTRSGEVYMDQDRDLSGDWTGSGRYDQVTVFASQVEAEAYVGSIRSRRHE